MNITTKRGATVSIPVLPVVAGLLLLILAVLTMRVGRIGGSEIGVFVNNVTGRIEVQVRPGSQFYCGIYNDFYVIDNTVQSLRMADSTPADQQQPQRGRRAPTRSRDQLPQNEGLNIKTKDGSDVSLDVALTYRLAQDAETIRARVIPECGLGTDWFEAGSENPIDSYKAKWIRDFARSVIRYKFGELKTDEFYSSSERDKKAREAEEELNAQLRPHGIEIVNVVPDRFRFYDEYETKISEKKAADQEVQSQIQFAKTAYESQKMREVEALASTNVEIAKLDGELKKQKLQVDAEASKAKLEAEAYAFTAKTQADAALYKAKNEAMSLLARAKAEADGMKALAASLSGEGGVSLVKLEYSKALKKATLQGLPYATDSRVQRLEVTPADAGSAPKQEGKR
jgi:regulator of protease activity HflC (stomatin/prohibitin superfamily)